MEICSTQNWHVMPRSGYDLLQHLIIVQVSSNTHEKCRSDAMAVKDTQRHNDITTARHMSSCAKLWGATS